MLAKNQAGYFKIESFGAVDGPGTRMVLFLQGCPLRCLYCHNPESWSFNFEHVITVDEVIEKYKKGINFYQKNGGITVSGGEPTFYLDFLIELASRCQKENIHFCIDSSLAFYNKNNYEKFNTLIDLTNLWLIDIKHIDPLKHKQLSGAKGQNELNFIATLELKQKPYWIRQVLVPGYTDDEKDLFALGKYLKNLKYMQRFELLPYHNMALFKYENLKIDYALKDVEPPTQVMINHSMEIIKKGMNSN